MTSPRPSPSPSPGKIKNGKKGNLLLAVNKILWATHHTTSQDGKHREEHRIVHHIQEEHYQGNFSY